MRRYFPIWLKQILSGWENYFLNNFVVSCIELCHRDWSIGLLSVLQIFSLVVLQKRTEMTMIESSLWKDKKSHDPAESTKAMFLSLYFVATPSSFHGKKRLSKTEKQCKVFIWCFHTQNHSFATIQLHE